MMTPSYDSVHKLLITPCGFTNQEGRKKGRKVIIVQVTY